MSIQDLYKILLSEKPSEEIKKNEEELFKLIPELKICKGFNQNNPWHIYDVFEHTLHVIDGVDSILSLRLAALFHDIGKPLSYYEDEQGIGHFHGHWEESQIIFEEFAKNHNLDQELTRLVSNLIYYHDLNLLRIDEDKKEYIFNLFQEDGLKLLFNLKVSDLYAHSSKYHDYISVINKQKERMFSKTR